MMLSRNGLGRLGTALLAAVGALCFAPPAMSQGNPPVFNNAPIIALPSICSTQTFSFSFALGNVMNHANGTLDLVMICGQNIVTIPGNGDGTFATASALTTPISSSFTTQISQISLADIDGDHQLDLVATDYTCHVDVFLGTGTGTFSPLPTQTSEGISPCSTSSGSGTFFVADFNGHGKPDIAIQNSSSSGVPSIIVLINGSTPGAVSFIAPIIIPLGIPANSKTQQFGGMAVGNFTGHTAPVVPDLAVAIGTFVSGAGFTNSVYVLQNNGSGTGFTALPGVTLPATPTTGTLVGLVAANLSSDGSLDVAAVDSGDGAMFVLYGHGTGNLTSCSPSGNTASLTSCQTSAGQTITGLPLFSARQLLPGNFSGLGGPPGLLFLGPNQCISVLQGATGGGLQTTAANYVANGISSVVVGDVNNDGYPDAIATATTGLSVFLNNTGGTLEGTQALIAGTFPGELSLLQNYFGNGEQDVAIVPANAGITGSAAAVTVFGAPASGPNGTLPQNSGPIPVPPGETITAMTSGCVLTPVNSSPCATPFVAYATYESAITTAFGFAFTTATGGAAKGIGALSSQQITAIAAGDFNSDGKTDLAFAIGKTNTILVFTGNGDGTFSTTPLTISLGAGVNPVALAVADFDGDGKADIAVLNQTANTVGILLNDTPNCSGGAPICFAAMASYPIGFGFPAGFTVGDFNGDTKPDIAVVGGPSIAILLNQGGGVFPATAPTPIALPALSSGAAIATGDFNGDGVLDLAVALPFNPNSLEILNGKGDGTFATATATLWSVGANPAAMVVADFKGKNGDGRPDIAVADGDPASNTVALLLNGTAAATTPPPPSAIQISPVTLPVGFVGESYFENFTATGGSGTGYTWSVTSGTALSAVGLSLTSAGAVSGSPNAAETAAAFTVQVTDSQGSTAKQNYTLTIYPTISIAPTTLPAGTVGTPYSQTLTVAGGSGGPYTFAVTAGTALSAVGLVLSPGGTISGTPNATEAAAAFTVQVTDSQGDFTKFNYTLTINSASSGPISVNVVETITVTDTPSLPDVFDSEPIKVTDTPIVRVVTPLTITANNSTRAYGAANPAFTGTVTGALNGDSFVESFSTTATASSPVGTYPITPAVTGTNLIFYSVTAVNGTLTITQAGTSVQLSTSANGSVADGTPVVLTANVASATTGTPTGTVTFLNGPTTVGTATLSQGVATLTISTLPAGQDNITAQYGGDTNFTGSTSAVETVSVNSPDYAVSANPSSITLAAGGTAPILITVKPEGFSKTVSFSCGSLPTYVTCAFKPSSSLDFSRDATTPQTLTLTVSVASTVAMLERNHSAMLAMAMPLGLLGLLPFVDKSRKRLRLYLGIIALALTVGGGIAGCSSGPLLPPAGTQTFTVMASSGTISHQLHLTITITN